ncbi:MAG TPA: CpsB/CapC family capsule biosynthesis tyrosine phosphatase [Puia sp.]|nr:CpsB/CapC family capsule biosynthesis tyrosine phosphatase [Puia sp.]
MVSFFRKKKSDVDFSALYTDMHSHLIPGIDDGVPDLDTALELVSGMMNLGYRKIITTPHVMWDLYKNTNDIIQSGWESVKNEIDRRRMAIDFYAAAEYFVDDHFDTMVEQDQPLLTLKENLVLVEFSFVQEPIELKKIIFRLQIKGYQPVIAHPERYLYFGANRSWYDEMKNAGCLFQVNLLSLAGYYGKGPFELAEYLAKKKYIDLLGSDLHQVRHLDALQNYPAMNFVKKLVDSGLIQNHLL